MLALAATGAAAGDSWIGVGTSINRQPDDFALPKSTEFGVEGAHTFDNQVLLQGKAEIQEDAGSRATSENLEGTVGYKLRFNDAFSLTGRGGIGENFQSASAGGDFPFYVFYLAADLDLTRRVTWNVITFRYRNAFDTANDFDTPQIATGLLFAVDLHNWISTKLSRSWKDGAPDDTGVVLGYKYVF